MKRPSQEGFFVIYTFVNYLQDEPIGFLGFFIMRIVSKEDLASRIHKRVSRVISKLNIVNALDIIIKAISKDLLEDRIISVRRFGTLSVSVRNEHLANNVSTGEVRMLPRFVEVKFHAHESFRNLLRLRRDRFSKRGKDGPRRRKGRWRRGSKKKVREGC